MHLRNVFILLVWSVVAEFCDVETEYSKDNECCKLCQPGTRMAPSSTCEYPDCRGCAEGEYQDKYNNEHLCKRQPSCDPNLNLISQVQSKTESTPCVCIRGYHCADLQCASCVKNKECQPGEKIRENKNQMADTVCEICPNGTFSDHKSARTCTPWETCSSGFKEVSPGSSKANRICEEQSGTVAIVTPVVVGVVVLVVLGLLIAFYKQSKTGSVSFVQKLRTCSFWGKKNTHQPVQDNEFIENGQPQQPVNQPQEDTEDLVKLDTPLSPGLSANGMPVSQDHSKSLILSETETEPASFSIHF